MDQTQILMLKSITGILGCLIIAAYSVQADDALTTRNKEIVRNFYMTVLVGRNVDAAPKFLRPDYIQHNPQVPTGLKGFMDTFRERFAQKLPSDYKRELLNVIGDNDMVVTFVRQTWTSSKDGQPHQALGFDMFRVQDGMIAEHWDADQRNSSSDLATASCKGCGPSPFNATSTFSSRRIKSRTSRRAIGPPATAQK